MVRTVLPRISSAGRTAAKDCSSPAPTRGSCPEAERENSRGKQEARPSACCGSRAFCLAGAADLCSNHWNWPLTVEELRNLAVPGDRGGDTATPTTYRTHSLSKRLGAKKVVDIVRRYEAGESARSLSQEHGVSTSAVVNLLRDSSVVVKKRRVTDAEARRIAQDYQAGATMRELQAKYELSHGAVSRALHRLDVEMRARAPRRKTP